MEKYVKKPEDRSKDHSAANVSAADRAKQYRTTDVFADGGVLFCRACNVVLNHQRKSTVDSHFKSDAHLRHAELPEGKKQKTLDTTLNIATVAAESRVAVCRDWLAMLVSANIPLTKTDHPNVREFLRTKVTNGGAIPHSHQLTLAYLPDLYETEKRKLKSYFMNSASVAVIVDEASDDQGRFVLNILLSKMELFQTGDPIASNKCFLADTMFLEQTNNTTVSQAVIRTVTDYGLDFNSIRIFCTDNAAYMLKAFKDTLSVVFPNCIHITCFAHIMNLVCETFRQPFKDVHKFGMKFKKIFAQPGQRKARYLKHLRQTGAAVALQTLPPDPVATRWNSWYEAMAYHNDHIDYYSEFITGERKLVGQSASSEALKWLSEHFGVTANVESLKVKLTFLANKSVPFLDLLASFESRVPCVVDAYEKLEDLRILLETNCQLLDEACAQFFVSATDMDTVTKTVIMQEFQEAFRLSAEKVQKYIDEFDGGQPGIKFVKACRIFKPQNTVLLSRNKEDYHAIPGMSDIEVAEFVKYVDVIGPEAVRSSCSSSVTSMTLTDITTFWKSASDRLPGLSRLAQMYIFSVTTSADAEHSFSKYNQLLSPQRTRLAAETLRMLEFLYWNLNTGP